MKYKAGDDVEVIDEQSQFFGREGKVQTSQGSVHYRGRGFCDVRFGNTLVRMVCEQLKPVLKVVRA